MTKIYKNKINVLITASTFPRWKNDSELQVVFDIAKNLTRRYKNLKIIVLVPGFPMAKNREIINNIKIYRYKYFINRLEKLHYQGGMISNIKKNRFIFLLIPFSLISQILAIKKIVKEEKIDIIHAHWLIPQGLAAVIYKKLFNKKIKIICTVHGTDILGLSGKIFYFLKCYVLKNINYITSVSTVLKEKITQYKIIPNKIIVIHNGINSYFLNSQIESHDLKQKYNISSFNLLFIGRLVEKKGVKYLIKAMPKILSEFSQIKLLIIGVGVNYNSFYKLTKKLQLQRNIIFIGKIAHNKIIDFYKMADIFISPSNSEGFGITFIEAMACGTAVIGSNIDGITDIIKHNRTGILVPQKNSTAIATAVINLLKNQDKKYKLVQNGKKFVSNNFNWEKISSQYYNLYSTLNNI